MQTWKYSLLMVIGYWLTTGLVQAAIPLMIPYTGTVSINGSVFDGNGLFKFAIVSQPCLGGDEGCVSLWSNDDSSGNGTEPAEAVNLTVSQGRFSVKLGDTNLSNMSPLSVSVFQNDLTYLRVWFDDGVNGFQLLSPDRQLVSVPYAYRAAEVDNLNPGQAVTRLNGLSDDITLEAGNNIDIQQNGNNLSISAAGGNGATELDCIQCVDSSDLSDNSINDSKISDLSWDKLTGVPAGLADGDDSYNDAQAVAAVKAADGQGSGLDADTVDGLDSSAFLPSTGGDINGGLTVGTPSSGNQGNGTINTQGHIYHNGTRITAPSVNGFTKGHLVFIADNGSHITSFDCGTVKNWESVGPTNSSAIHSWSALNSVPNTVKFLLVKIYNSAVSSAPGIPAGREIRVRLPGATTVTSNQSIVSNTYALDSATTGSLLTSNLTTSFIPINQNRTFEMDMNGVNNLCTISLIGWVE